jgi:glycosyltransferase involved in cell wall biosynthesis
LATEPPQRGRPPGEAAGAERILVVGSGTRFLSGISVYTFRLANTLSARHRVSLITMRRLLPARLYPGRTRVGASLTALEPAAGVTAYDGVDWFWLPSILRAALVIIQQRPQVAIFQWWTGTVLHSYIFLALLIKLLGGRLVIEFHEVLDTAEAGIPLVHRYVRTFGPLLMGMADGFAVHSDFDRDLVGGTWPQTRRRPLAVLPHGPHDHYQAAQGGAPLRAAPPGVANLLFFGVIRPFKGLEHLVQAFEAIPESEIDHYWLTVVGETWEGWTLPAELIARSPRRDRITFVNRYVTDEELEGYLEGADAVVLPYLRSSLSGPLHVAMGYGLPIVMTEVGGNVEAAAGYGGVVLVPPADPTALAEAIRRVPELRKTTYAHPHSWSDTAAAYEQLLGRVWQRSRRARRSGRA